MISGATMPPSGGAKGGDWGLNHDPHFNQEQSLIRLASRFTINITD